MQQKNLIIVTDRDKFQERIKHLNPDMRKFYTKALDNKIRPDEDPKKVVRLNLDNSKGYLPGTYNLYGYTQKQFTKSNLELLDKDYNIEIIDAFRWLNNKIHINNSLTIMAKPRIKQKQYYKNLNVLNVSVLDDLTFTKVNNINRIRISQLNDNLFYKEFLEFIWELFSNGLWLNNFNTYSIRYATGFQILDPDIFFIKKFNPLIKNINTKDEFIRAYLKFKLVFKSTEYTIEDPENLSDDILEYIYENFIFLERVAQYVKNYN